MFAHVAYTCIDLYTLMFNRFVKYMVKGVNNSFCFICIYRRARFQERELFINLKHTLRLSPYKVRYFQLTLDFR